MTTDAPPPTRRASRADRDRPGTATDELDTGDDPAADQPETVIGPADPVQTDTLTVTAADGPDTVADSTAPDADRPAADRPDTAETPGATADPTPTGPARPIALAWVDEHRFAARALTSAPGAAASPVFVAPELLAKAPRRSPLRPGVLVPLLLLVLAMAVYAATTLLWPLHAIAPQVEAAAVQTVPAPAASPTWPSQGGAAVAIAGIDGALASTGDASTIASITKVVTALVVLDRSPLAVGESGPEFRFTAADSANYWQYRANGESALDVPVGGVLTQYQMLEGILIGSANNYADRLASSLWPSDAVFADAANTWLDAHGVSGVTIVDPTGIESGNTASPEALLSLASHAMANPVIAEIVARESVQLPGAGTVENTNPLLADPGVVGIKTGSLDAFNLLAAKDVAVGSTTVRIYASMLGQPDPDTRDAALRAVFDRTEQEVQLRPSVTAGTLAGQVVTRWDEPVDILTVGDASVVLWNGGSGAAESDFALGDAAEAGDVVGELTVAGPLDRASVDLALAGDVEGPTAWWRLTHPLDLFGLN